MNVKKNVKTMLAAMLAVDAVIFTPVIYNSDSSLLTLVASVANAEIRTYEAIGSFDVVNETLEHAKKEAKLNAERHIAEEIYADLKSDTESENGKLTNDEIVLMTEGVMRIIDVKYQIDSAKDGAFIVRATVTAEIDTEELEKLLGDISK